MDYSVLLVAFAWCGFGLVPATSASDGTLTCPTAWTGTVTLVCEVAFSSLSKCTYSNKSTSFFEVERNGIKTTSCAVTKAEFASCSFTPGSATGCGCTKTGTHYRFIHQITNADDDKYRGAWGCTKSCFDDNGNNPLEIAKTGGCTNDGGSVSGKPSEQDTDDGSLPIAAIAGGAGAAVVVIIVIVVVIVVVVTRRRQRRTPAEPTKTSRENDCREEHVNAAYVNCGGKFDDDHDAYHDHQQRPKLTNTTTINNNDDARAASRLYFSADGDYEHADLLGISCPSTEGGHGRK